MDSKNLKNILIDFGLNQHEAVVYYTSLSLGPATILQISRAAAIKRTTVYSVVESLKQKGLIIVQLKGLKQLFAAENPEKLETILAKRQEELKKALPEFSALYNLKGRESLIKYYEGLNAVKSVYESLLKDIRPHQDYLIVSNLDDWMEADKNFFMDFTVRRAELARGIGINIRLLLQDSALARETKKKEKLYFEEVKILPPDTKLTTNLVVIPKKVVIHQLTPPIFAMVIENPNIVRMHREMFEIMWGR